jgi:hypothetical protein
MPSRGDRATSSRAAFRHPAKYRCWARAQEDQSNGNDLGWRTYSQQRGKCIEEPPVRVDLLGLNRYINDCLTFHQTELLTFFSFIQKMI